MSLTKNLEKKKNGQIWGRTNRIKPVIYPTIQLVIVILYTKYELSILYSCGDIFDKKCYELRKDGRNQGQMKTSIPPLFQSRGIKMTRSIQGDHLNNLSSTRVPDAIFA